MPTPFPYLGNEPMEVRDLREQILAGSQQCTPTPMDRLAFYGQKLRLFQAIEQPTEGETKLLNELRSSVIGLQTALWGPLSHEASDPFERPLMPLPDGLGYGTYYESESFRFNRYSVLNYRIVTAQRIGNPTNEWLYLTSTNRSPRGAEAYVSYRRNGNAVFRVFDWSKKGDARFVICIPYEDLGEYITPHVAAGTEYATLNVVNSTRKDEANWINEVLLFNHQMQTYDLIYANTYTLVDLEERDYREWGPIVETFSPFPFNTVVVGFFGARLFQDDHAPEFLTDANTRFVLRYTNFPGYDLVHHEENHTYTVHW